MNRFHVSGVSTITSRAFDSAFTVIYFFKTMRAKSMGALQYQRTMFGLIEFKQAYGAAKLLFIHFLAVSYIMDTNFYYLKNLLRGLSNVARTRTPRSKTTFDVSVLSQVRLNIIVESFKKGVVSCDLLQSRFLRLNLSSYQLQFGERAFNVEVPVMGLLFATLPELDVRLCISLGTSYVYTCLGS